MSSMEVRAVLRYARISPQKVRMLIGAVKGLPVETGIQKIKFMPQKGARILEKLLNSAVANADQKAGVDVDALVIKNITADQGPVLKRFAARARGRGTRIIKRTSHIAVTLSDETVS